MVNSPFEFELMTVRKPAPPVIELFCIAGPRGRETHRILDGNLGRFGASLEQPRGGPRSPSPRGVEEQTGYGRNSDGPNAHTLHKRLPRRPLYEEPVYHSHSRWAAQSGRRELPTSSQVPSGRPTGHISKRS